MGGRTKRAVRSEGDRFEADAEVLVLDGLVRAAVLGGSVAVGAGSMVRVSASRTYHGKCSQAVAHAGEAKARLAA